ncbi:MAG: VOC family protein [Propionibacteriaceae bacterium]
MDLTIRSCFLPHSDAVAAVAFYRDVLGFEVRADVGQEDQRSITVGPVGQRDVSIVLHPPLAHPGLTPEERGTIEELMARGGCLSVNLTTRDLDETFAVVEASGAEVTQEPIRHGNGVRDCAFRDPAGNTIRIQERC